jgi:hypothetical protein
MTKPPASLESLEVRIRSDYDEMPDLVLTAGDAGRLWGIDVTLCAALLERLVATGFLRRTVRGAYVAARVPP